jgi:rhodanese-related sulfurtransferase
MYSTGKPLRREYQRLQLSGICVYCATLFQPLVSGYSVIEQIFEFIGNHYILVSIFVFLLVAFIINEGKQGGSAITPGNLVKLVNREGAVIVDIRDNKDFGNGHIAGAVSMPLAAIDSRVGELEKYKDKPIVLVCKMGQTASAAGRKLKAQGYEDVRRLSGGMAEWTATNLPVVK